MIEYKMICGSKTHIAHFPVWDIMAMGVAFGLAVSAVVLMEVKRNG